MTAYAELQVTTSFSFLEGASHPHELVLTAAALGLRALAVTDRNSLAGVVRAHVAAREHGLRLVVGARLDLEDGPSLLCYPRDRAAYGRLCRLITTGRRRAPKGECRLALADVHDHAAGQIFAVVPPAGDAPAPDASFAAHLAELGRRYPGGVFLVATQLYRGDDARRLEALAGLAAACGTPLVAANDVRMHAPGRRALADVLTCIREHCTIDEAGFRLAANAERHLKAPEEMARLFARYPEAVARTAEIAERCRFCLDELRYEYPDETVDDGATAQETLARLARAGAAERYPDGVPARVVGQIDHELALIEQLGYAPYFLTVHDIVRFARARGILCQGRGSAANSAVCYCLGITAVDPSRLDLLFERFVSAERNEPPDIDVDFEHERREEVIQYIYAKYGRDRAGLAATVICYRARGAIREVGKAMGLPEDTVAALSGTIWGWSDRAVADERVREAGLDPDDRRLRLALDLAAEIIGFPRHLSQHVGGFVLTRGPLDEVVPIENAAMAERTVVEWDKDDLDALGILKVDVLGLGMLTCLRKAFDLLAAHGGPRLTLAAVPAEDAAVYDMLCRADSIGVFQVESRAQMTMLPRLKPRDFYDLVIEVAIVRPGPIQGDMVHPYLRRRNGEEKAELPSEELRRVLGKTLGVPLFQEQAMQIAIVAAGFTPGEADRLRRAMATFKRLGTIHTFRDRFIDGMARRGYDRDFAERCFRQIEGFGTYGFPESHAASFALLVYVSAWLKCHHPAVFAAALLNSQPMGFYAPAQIVRDAHDHGVEVRPVDVNRSAWDCTIEPAAVRRKGWVRLPILRDAALWAAPQDEDDVNMQTGPHPEERSAGSRLEGWATAPNLAVRLGLRQVKGLAEADAAALAAARGAGYADVAALWRAGGLGPAALECLARADAFRSMGLDRRQALWAIKALPPAPLPLFAAMGADEAAGEPAVRLPEMALGEHVADDYRSLRLSLKAHPVSFLREGLARDRFVPAARLAELRNGGRVQVAGIVLVRQRPGSASGVIFTTIEDETGVANIVIWPQTFERFRRTVLRASLLGVAGRLQIEGLVIHVVADRLYDLTGRLAALSGPDAAGRRPPHEAPLARADEVKRPGPDPVPRRDQPRGLFRSRDFH